MPFFHAGHHPACHLWDAGVQSPGAGVARGEVRGQVPGGDPILSAQGGRRRQRPGLLPMGGGGSPLGFQGCSYAQRDRARSQSGELLIDAFFSLQRAGGGGGAGLGRMCLERRSSAGCRLLAGCCFPSGPISQRPRWEEGAGGGLEAAWGFASKRGEGLAPDPGTAAGGGVSGLPPGEAGGAGGPQVPGAVPDPLGSGREHPPPGARKVGWRGRYPRGRGEGDLPADGGASPKT